MYRNFVESTKHDNKITKIKHKITTRNVEYSLRLELEYSTELIVTFCIVMRFQLLVQAGFCEYIRWSGTTYSALSGFIHKSTN